MVQRDFLFHSTFPRWVLDYPGGKDNQMCLTSSSHHSNRQWPSAIDKKGCFMPGLRVITFKNGHRDSICVIKKSPFKKEVLVKSLTQTTALDSETVRGGKAIRESGGDEGAISPKHSAGH